MEVARVDLPFDPANVIVCLDWSDPYLAFADAASCELGSGQQAARISTRRTWPLPVFVMPPCRRLRPVVCSLATWPT